MNFPAWDQMTDAQKFEFLNKWCQNISTKVDEHTSTIQMLHERLLAVEAKRSADGA
jgi:hypothetical protein